MNMGQQKKKKENGSDNLINNSIKTIKDLHEYKFDTSNYSKLPDLNRRNRTTNHSMTATKGSLKDNNE